MSLKEFDLNFANKAKNLMDEFIRNVEHFFFGGEPAAEKKVLNVYDYLFGAFVFLLFVFIIIYIGFLEHR